MALELLSHYRKELASMTLVPSGGGRFEVSVDGGTNWEPAEICAKDSPLTWYLWKYTWQVAEQPGEIEICARSTANNGTIQEVNGFDAENGGATGYHTIDAEIQT